MQFCVGMFAFFKRFILILLNYFGCACICCICVHTCSISFRLSWTTSNSWARSYRTGLWSVEAVILYVLVGTILSDALVEAVISDVLGTRWWVSAHTDHKNNDDMQQPLKQHGWRSAVWSHCHSEACHQAKSWTLLLPSSSESELPSTNALVGSND